MVFNGMDHFLQRCKLQLVTWYNQPERDETHPFITTADVYVVWCCKTLQNCKALLSTNINGDGVYAEYTYNGDKRQLYEDVYIKDTNNCHKE